MRVLLTGHHGYVGSVMAPMLLEAGHEVVGIDTFLYEGSTFGPEVVTPGLTEIRKDIRDVDPADLEGVEAIIHLAALSNDPLSDLNPALTYEINHQASVKLATLAKARGIERFIFASSCSNYGAAGDAFMDETSEVNPITAYGKSKVLVEQEVAKLADDRFSPTFMRSATAYGASPRLRFDIVVNNLTAWAFTTGRVLLKSDGMPWRPLVHVEDMGRGFLAVLHAPREVVHNQAFNVGQTKENYRIRELAEIVAEVVPGSQVEFAADASPDQRNYRVDCSKIAQALPEFQPQWDVRKGAQQLYEAYQRVEIDVNDFEGPRYRRISRLKHLLETGKLDTHLRWQ
ncbi:MAG: NAD(P)-dependent oxidoreductase [Anaerolineales bacterium]|nr:NAD(P)-dependent oxidoreductase [Anaerolineales bacterium]